MHARSSSQQGVGRVQSRFRGTRIRVPVKTRPRSIGAPGLAGFPVETQRGLESQVLSRIPWDDGTVLVGATMEEAGFDERATVAGVRDLLEAACDITPQAWTAAFDGVRVGLRPGTADGSANHRSTLASSQI